MRLSPIAPNGALRYELATRQWIDIFPDRRRALGTLAETIKKVLNASATAENPGTTALAVTPPLIPAGAPPNRHQPRNAARRHASHRRARHSGIRGNQGIACASYWSDRQSARREGGDGGRSADEFCEQLAAHVAAASERTSFVQAVRARLPTKA